MTDASLQKIAATYGTPTFVFDTDALQARVRAIQAIWGREIDLCYSIKANPFLLPAMMQAIQTGDLSALYEAYDLPQGSMDIGSGSSGSSSAWG